MKTMYYIRVTVELITGKKPTKNDVPNIKTLDMPSRNTTKAKVMASKADTDFIYKQMRGRVKGFKDAVIKRVETLKIIGEYNEEIEN